MATGLINVEHIIEFSGVDIILFLIAMMIIVGFLEDKKFFEHFVAIADAMNTLGGYQQIAIFSPREVIRYEDEEV